VRATPQARTFYRHKKTQGCCDNSFDWVYNWTTHHYDVEEPTWARGQMCCDGRNAMRGDRCCGDQNYTLADYGGSKTEDDVCCYGLHTEYAMGCKDKA
jgi:hypothetical protein